MKLKLLAAAVALTLSAGAQAALLIDNFSQGDVVTATIQAGGVSQTVVGSTISLNAGSTGLIGATRTITNTAAGLAGDAGNTSEAKVNALAGKLAISNQDGVTGTTVLSYLFNATDFTSYGSAILMDVLTIDTSTTVDMTFSDGVNTATSGPQSFGLAGSTFYELFSSFSGSQLAFLAATSLTLTFTGDPAWDGSFQFLATDNPPSVPEPATLGLLGLGLLGLGLSRRKRA